MIYLELTDTQGVALSAIIFLLLLCGAAFFGSYMGGRTAEKKIGELSEELETRKAELELIRANAKPKSEPIVATHASKVVYHAAPIPASKNPDDLTLIDGIGPKTAEILNKEGIYTFEQLAGTSVLRIVNMLKNAGPRFQVQDPTLWPRQAQLAFENKWEDLEKLKLSLLAGR